MRLKAGPRPAITHITVQPVFHQAVYLFPIFAKTMIPSLKKDKAERVLILIEQ
jgi:hypothetical protein